MLSLVRRIFLGIAGLIVFVSCHSYSHQNKLNDTAVALKILLDSAFYKPRLEKADKINDSIIFEYNPVLANYLPRDLKYKLLTEDEMCAVMVVKKITHLQFFSLDEFKKTAKGYNTALGTHCMVRAEMITRQKRDTICESSKYCNAILYMKVLKKNSTLTGSEFQITTY